jgi:hypothetical protein
MRAIMEARMMEVVLRDVRSSTEAIHVDADGKGYRIRRWVLAGGRAEPRNVAWRLVDGKKVTRQEESGPVQEFDFTQLFDSETPSIRFRVERVPEGTFDPFAGAKP